MELSLNSIEKRPLQYPLTDAAYLDELFISRLDNLEESKEQIHIANKRYLDYSAGLIKGIDEDTAFQEAFQRIK